MRRERHQVNRKPLWAQLVSVAVFVLLATAPSGAQATRKPPELSRPPDLADVAYGPHQRNVLDLWKAKSDRPTPLLVFIHGGGFRQGDKRDRINPFLLDLCLANGISFATINYRLTDTVSYPAPMQDGARAIQFLRWRAKDWNLDPGAFGASGGSAGAGISLWVAFHDDLADPASVDPVKRQSTRLSAAALTGAQTTYDPRVIREVVGDAAAQAEPLLAFWGLRPEELNTEKAFRIFQDCSPINHLSAGDPPVFLLYSEPNLPVPADAAPGAGIHHPRFGFYLKEKMDKLGIECIVRLREKYPEDFRQPVARDMVEFFLKQFRKKR